MQEIKKDKKLNKATEATKYNYLLNARKSAERKQNKKASFDWLTEHSRNFLAAGYVAEGIAPEVRIREIADRAEKILGVKGYSDKFYNYMEQGFFSLSSPVWSNFGKERGLPISCFGSNISDDMGNILFTQSEVGMMSKLALMAVWISV